MRIMVMMRCGFWLVSVVGARVVAVGVVVGCVSVVLIVVAVVATAASGDGEVLFTKISFEGHDGTK